MEGQGKISGICDSAFNDNQQPARESSFAVSGFAGELEFDQNIGDDCSELSNMSVSSTLSSEPELLDLSPPSDLEDSLQYTASRLVEQEEFDGDVDVDGLAEHVYFTGILNLPESQPEAILEPITDAQIEPMSAQLVDQVIETIREQMDESMAEPQLTEPLPMQEYGPVPYTDLGSLSTDCAAVQRILIQSEQRYQEVARIWEMFKNFVHLFANPPSGVANQPPFMPVQQLFPLLVPPNPNLQNILDPQRTLSWTEYQQQVEEFFDVADLFVELIQHEIIGHRFP